MAESSKSAEALPRSVAGGGAVFKHQTVRDLAWAVSSPSLMSAVAGMQIRDSLWTSREPQDFRDWLMALDAEPSALLNRMEARSGKQVGLYFEDLLAFWLEVGSPYQLLARNLQVHQGKITKGAFDFILETPVETFEHWEVTVKFYLQSEAATSWEKWIGPGARDRLDIKMDRMRDHQLPLSSSDVGKEALYPITGDRPIAQRAVTKGQFFSYWHGKENLPDGANSKNTVGAWLKNKEMEAFAEMHPEAFYCRRDKPSWLAPLIAHRDEVQNPIEWMEEYRARHGDKPVMFSLMKGDPEFMREVKRIFVVPNSWPSSAKRTR